MLRNSTLNQLKRINTEIEKQGGITDRKSPSEENNAKVLWINNPLDGKRKIATYDQMFTIDIPDSPTKVTMKNEKKIQINGYDYYYIDNKLYEDEKCENEINIYKQLTKNEREQLYNQLKYGKNNESKTDIRELTDIDWRANKKSVMVVINKDLYNISQNPTFNMLNTYLIINHPKLKKYIDEIWNNLNKKYENKNILSEEKDR